MVKSSAKPVAAKTTSPTKMKVVNGALIGVGALTFFFAQSALWISNTIFTQATFVGIVEDVLKTEESRQAISRTIVHSAFQNNPVAEQVVGKQVTSLLSGFLGSDLAGQVFNRVANRSYAYLTASNREDIAINLTQVKDPLTKLVNLVESSGREVKFDPSNIPDSITLVETESVPSFASYIQTMLFANGLLWFATIASFATYVYLNRQRLARSFYIIGGSIIAICLLALFTGPFIPPAIASLISLVEIRSVVEALSVALLAPFQAQLTTTIIIASLLLLAVSLRHIAKRGITKVVTLVR